ncbi:hypothetical protein HELRODRAFT_193780 [Helobdella robusta]|uniref:Uncharacterized protein n=1 Tax=Helobdella robusta TaxID=6412 RepID=T1FVC5_HELRO|nr:hypothetical protein HELRODRAFT_193780 [Helobdella robusta]ESN94761.1 hypothetical protein HELRODRAFT_193780 [Helobdella robusta]
MNVIAVHSVAVHVDLFNKLFVSSVFFLAHAPPRITIRNNVVVGVVFVVAAVVFVVATAYNIFSPLISVLHAVVRSTVEISNSRVNQLMTAFIFNTFLLINVVVVAINDVVVDVPNVDDVDAFSGTVGWVLSAFQVVGESILNNVVIIDVINFYEYFPTIIWLAVATKFINIFRTLLKSWWMMSKSSFFS